MVFAEVDPDADDAATADDSNPYMSPFFMRHKKTNKFFN